MLDVTVTKDVLQANRVPTLAICGEQDPVTASVIAMRSVMRNLTVQVVPGLDHNTLPASKEFGEAVRNVIASVR
jgi:pimeloyl-ACP methyl ester carboxylesterase